MSSLKNEKIDELWKEWLFLASKHGIIDDFLTPVENEIYKLEQRRLQFFYPSYNREVLLEERRKIKDRESSYTGGNPNRNHGLLKGIDVRLAMITPSDVRSDGLYKLFQEKGGKYPFKLGQYYYYSAVEEYGVSRTGKTCVGKKFKFKSKPQSVIEPLREKVNSIVPKYGWKAKVIRQFDYITTYKVLDWYLSKFFSDEEVIRLYS